MTTLLAKKVNKFLLGEIQDMPVAWLLNNINISAKKC